MNAEETAFVIGLCRLRSGLRVLPDRSYLIETRLAPAARQEGLPSAQALVAAARDPAHKRLRWRIVEAMACGETSFFRDRQVFEALRTRIIPELSCARAGAPLRIWSAACGAGQEIYSLAIMAKEFEEASGGAIALFASDLNSIELERAKSGLFSQSEVQRGLPIRLLIRYFQKIGDSWRASSALRGRVRWRRLNLIAPFEHVGSFDVILCRNVLQGMEAPYRETVLRSLRQSLASDGILILGAAETAEAAGGVFLADDMAAGVFRAAPMQQAAAA